VVWLDTCGKISAMLLELSCSEEVQGFKGGDDREFLDHASNFTTSCLVPRTFNQFGGLGNYLPVRGI